MDRNVYSQIASACVALRNCEERGNGEWAHRWRAYLTRIERELLPRGGGFDGGTAIVVEKSGPRRIVLTTAFHHMNDAGMYDGWTEHRVIIEPTLTGIEVRVTGRNRNGIKDYMGEVFAALADHAVPFNA